MFPFHLDRQTHPDSRDNGRKPPRPSESLITSNSVTLFKSDSDTNIELQKTMFSTKLSAGRANKIKARF